MVRAEKGHVGGLHRAVPFRGHDHQGMVQAEQNLGIGPVQVDGPLPRGRARKVSHRSSKASNWIKVTAGGIADARAIVPAAPRRSLFSTSVS